MQPYNYKLIICSINEDESIFSKLLDKPVFLLTLEEAQQHLERRKEELKEQGRKLSFYKIWEFGAEEYMDMGDMLEEV